MRHIVIVTTHMAGDINAACELTKRLRAAGHRVTLASPVDITERVAVHGLDFLYVGSKKPSETTIEAKPGGWRRLAALARRLGLVTSVAARRAAVVDGLDIDGFLSAMRPLEADLYLIDIELPMEIMAVSSTETPVATWTTILSLWKRPGLPPLHTDILPGRQWRGSRMGMEWAWLRYRIWKWLRAQRLRITRVGVDQRSILRQVAVRTHFALGDEVARYHWLIPFVYRNIPTLMFNAREIEFPHEPDPVCRYVGPILNSSRRVIADASAIEVTRRLETIYARRQSDAGRSLIYCSFGAWHRGDDREFFLKVLAALGRHPEWEAVIGLGGRVEPESLGVIPGNVHLFEWAPQLEVLAQSDIAIHHAGINTINECVVAGVPMVVYPYQFWDTSGAAARVVYHGLGVRGDRVGDSAEDIEAHINRVLSDGSFSSQVLEMKKRFDAYESDNTAVKAVVALAVES